MTVGAVIALAGKDRPIYVMVGAFEKTFWYVIEEKSPMESALSSGDEVIGCESETDRVRRLPLPDSGSSTNNLAVVKSCAYLIGGDGYTLKHMQDESVGFRHIDLRNLDMGVDEWLLGGGKLFDGQFGGGVALGHDGYAYCVGPTVYRFRPGVDRTLEKLPVPPQGPNPCRYGLLHRLRLLGLTKEKLYVYFRQDDNGTNVMLSFDLESRKWDEDVLDDNFLGTWSPGAVLFQDRYLFSFGTRSPKRKPKTPEEEEAITIRRRRVQEIDEGWGYVEEDELVPGIYVFDLHEGRWLPEPVEGLPTDGKVMPHAFRPLPEAPLYCGDWNPRLFQIRKDEDDHRLALLWDAVGNIDGCKLIWCKFMINRCDTSAEDNPRFSAISLSPGFCPLDEDTFQIVNSAVGMYDLNVDLLDVHADKTTFHRFDKFNLKHNPCGQSRLREIFLKQDNLIQGRFLAEVTKEVLKDLEAMKYQMAEYMISVYGRKQSEWDQLASWFVNNDIYSENVVWLIQLPRLYNIYKKMGIVTSFQNILDNVFIPLFEVTVDPNSHPQLHLFLKQVVGFDVVDDENKPERRPTKHMPTPSEWTNEFNPAYSYYAYYCYANLYTLNKLRESKGMTTIKFQPHCGEAGDVDHLAAGFLVCHNISHGINLRYSPVLQYLYYLGQVGLLMSPLSNNSLFLDYKKNPFPVFFQRGINVSLSSDDPLLIHLTKEALVEEYSVAAQVWKLSACDLCEIARNSVYHSGFSHAAKAHWLGSKYFLRGPKGNDIQKTNVPNLRIAFRETTWKEEMQYIYHGEAEFPEEVDP